MRNAMPACDSTRHALRLSEYRNGETKCSQSPLSSSASPSLSLSGAFDETNFFFSEFQMRMRRRQRCLPNHERLGRAQ
jgi:hypothetical protein